MSRFHSSRVVFVAIVSVLLAFPALASVPKASLLDGMRAVIGQPEIPTENLTDGTGGGGSTENCGPIDPGTPCYGSGGGGADSCKAPHDYESCQIACSCIYTKAKTACGRDSYCKYIATAEYQRCLGECGRQFPSP